MNLDKKNLFFPAPCPHCGKENDNKWCYQYFDTKNILYSVCNRENRPATGWEETEYRDKEGKIVYRQAREFKAPRPEGFKTWEYLNRSGHPMVRVCRTDKSGQDRKFWQEHWDGKMWQKGLNGLERHHIPIYNYQTVRNAIAQGETIWITGGEGKADLLTGMGLIATCNLGGDKKWRESDTKDLSGVKEVILCPDRDEKSKGHFEAVYLELKQQLGCKIKWMPAKPESYFWANLPPDHGLDVYDWHLEGATKDDILAAVRDVSPFKSEVKPQQLTIEVEAKTIHVEPDDDDRPIKLSTRKLYHFIKDNYALKFNELLKIVELDGEEYDVDEAYLDLAIEHNVKATKLTSGDLFVKVARRNSYHPIKAYFDSLAPINPVSLDDLASRYFGTEDPLYNVFLKKTLIAAVARLYKPGCQVDTALVLQGKQGAGKSSFFKVLAQNWFSCSMGAGADRDDLLILHQNWILEWGEIEKLFGKKSAAELKPFITRGSDTFREPYARKAKDIKRSSILVGTTNRSQFLCDSTGERRYWVIPIEVEKIDRQLLEQERDAIWKAAYEAFKAGEKWHLTDEEEYLSSLNNARFAVEDTWEEALTQWLEDKTSVTVKQILDECLSANLIDQGEREQHRVRDILTALGWTPGIEGKSRRRVWKSPPKFEITGLPDQKVITPDHPSDHPPEPLKGGHCPPQTEETGDQGDHPKTQNLFFSIGQKIVVYNLKHKNWLPSVVEDVAGEGDDARYYCRGGYCLKADQIRPILSKS